MFSWWCRISPIRNDRTILDGWIDFYLPEFKPNWMQPKTKPTTAICTLRIAVEWCLTHQRKLIISISTEKPTMLASPYPMVGTRLGANHVSENDLPRLLGPFVRGERKIGARQVTVKPVKDTKPNWALLMDITHAKCQGQRILGSMVTNCRGGVLVWKGDEAELKRLCLHQLYKFSESFKTHYQLLREHPSSHDLFQIMTSGTVSGYESRCKADCETDLRFWFVSWADPSDTYSGKLPPNGVPDRCG